MRDKQIEEMAKTVCHLERTCDQCMTSFECKAMTYAKRFYDAGYRKSKDLAREIFEEIEKSIDKCVITEHFKGSYFELSKFLLGLAELKKIYIGEDTNVLTKESEGNK